MILKYKQTMYFAREKNPVQYRPFLVHLVIYLGAVRVYLNFILTIMDSLKNLTLKK